MYQLQPMIPVREWKALITDVDGKKQRKEGKTPLGAPR